VSTEGTFIPLAEVARPHGVTGELRLKVYNAESRLLVRGRDVLLRLADGSERAMRVSSSRPTVKALLVRFEGVADRSAAEALRGAKVCVERAAFPPPDEDEFYACDVEGAEVVLAEDGTVVGVAVGLTSYPTCDVLVVQRPADQGRLEVPLTETYVEKVDLGAKIVRLRSIDGLS
jgi:16S rRNA processing protein RimM